MLEYQDAQNKLDHAQKEFDKAKANKELLENNPDIELAEDLHKLLCPHNHADACDWYYGEWNGVGPNHARSKYLEKARAVLRNPELRPEVVIKLVKILKD